VISVGLVVAREAKRTHAVAAATATQSRRLDGVVIVYVDVGIRLSIANDFCSLAERFTETIRNERRFVTFRMRIASTHTTLKANDRVQPVDAIDFPCEKPPMPTRLRLISTLFSFPPSPVTCLIVT